MATRVRTKLEDQRPSLYFTSPKANIKFVSSGCCLLDCALGGGFALGRLANVVGDKSTSKTGLGCEALINFLLTYKNGKASYRDAEHAFDKDYAAAMGVPVKKVDFGDDEYPLLTIEDFYYDCEDFSP